MSDSDQSHDPAPSRSNEPAGAQRTSPSAAAPSTRGRPPVFPVGLVLRGRRCLVVGGGRVAGRKVAALLGCQATVTMVAPDVTDALTTLFADGTIAAVDGPPLDVQVRPYQPGEAAGYRLVVAATGVAAVDRLVHDDAEAAGVWVNYADQPEQCSVLLPSVHRDGPVTISVSTDGASPALAAWVRRRVAAAVGSSLGPLAELLHEARRALHAQGRSTEAVDWTSILDGPLPDLVAAGRLAEARSLLAASLAEPVPGAEP
jgi:siroheme synthase-like protein